MQYRRYDSNNKKKKTRVRIYLESQQKIVDSKQTGKSVSFESQKNLIKACSGWRSLELLAPHNSHCPVSVFE